MALHLTSSSWGHDLQKRYQRVKQIIVHPKFDSNTLKDDIAVLLVDF